MKKETAYFAQKRPATLAIIHSAVIYRPNSEPRLCGPFCANQTILAMAGRRAGGQAGRRAGGQAGRHGRARTYARRRTRAGARAHMRHDTYKFLTPTTFDTYKFSVGPKF